MLFAGLENPHGSIELRRIVVELPGLDYGRAALRWASWGIVLTPAACNFRKAPGQQQKPVFHPFPGSVDPAAYASRLTMSSQISNRSRYKCVNPYRDLCGPGLR